MAVRKKSNFLAILLPRGIPLWGDDLIIGTWFHTKRIAFDGSTVWSYEHEGLVTAILDLGAGLIAVIGEAPAGQNPASIVLLDPDAEPRIPEDASFEYDE